MESPQIRRALISVSDKEGLAEFARGLTEAGVQLYSTGGTAAHLREQGLAVLDIAAYTGFPEMMDGRLKTLHPKVFGGILCRHDRVDDRQSLETQGIVSFELVIVNLYPFKATVARPDSTWAEAIEKIDIGGPSLVRAAAKNHAFVTIATSSSQYDEILRPCAATVERMSSCGDAWPQQRSPTRPTMIARLQIISIGSRRVLTIRFRPRSRCRSRGIRP
jgi:phosphoribosylaminoimidazolecarboxamide formyltransferase/IMP cyclohydrolase